MLEHLITTNVPAYILNININVSFFQCASMTVVIVFARILNNIMMFILYKLMGKASKELIISVHHILNQDHWIYIF